MSDSRVFEAFLKQGNVCTDTRSIIPGAIFFALKGDNFNGNKFAKTALDDGCSLAVIDEKEFALDDENYILVDNCLKALQNLARQYRHHLGIKVIGLTGSNGKTTTKELCHAVLAKKYNVLATKGNLNNHIGVPLTLLSIKKEHELAIVEMGANHTEEIAQLCEIADPDYGLITNIGKAHLEGFGGIEGIIKGKGELFEYLEKTDGKTFLNTQLPHLNDMASENDTMEYQSEGGVYNICIEQRTPLLNFSWKNRGAKSFVESKLTGDYNIHNMAAAIAIGDFFEVEAHDISEALSSYYPENNRSQLEDTGRNLLIKDAYNANPTSVENALHNLSNMDSYGKFFILGDMLELGDSAKMEHEEIIDLAVSLNLRGILIGPCFKSLETISEYKSFIDTTEAKEHLKVLNLEAKTILIKGSRGIKLEELYKLF